MPGLCNGTAVVAIALMLATSPIRAEPASQLRNLVGARGSSGEMELERRGFTNVTGHEGRDAVYAYWWNARDKNCISVKTQDGRYVAITDAPNRDCNQKGGGNGAAIAGLAVGAVLIAALASSHKSSHHDNGEHYADDREDAQYGRGYSDGLHHTPYHNYDRSDAYSSGYEAGVDQRNRNTSNHSARGGYVAHASLSGIEGQDSVRAFDEMQNRGFRGVDSFSSGNTQYGIYYNPRTRQCVQLTNADNRVYNAMELDSNPKCR